MKKFLALLLAALMVLAMFTACAKTATPSQEETTAPTETAEPAAPARSEEHTSELQSR